MKGMKEYDAVLSLPVLNQDAADECKHFFFLSVDKYNLVYAQQRHLLNTIFFKNHTLS